ncbi:MAG: response regulator [Marinilabiliales bacterium]|nr:response regulator [Marinilabiliales bacterium]
MEGKKILIVEDEQRLAEVLRKQLEGSGFYADVAPDGLSGFTLFSGNTYDLIILDILLPHMDGYRLCEEIRKINSRVPIIMLTALGTPEDKLHDSDTGQMTMF